MQERLVGAVSAQTNEPRIQLGSDYAIDDNPDGNGDLVIEHLPSGAEFRYDQSEDIWMIGALESTNLTNIEADRTSDSASTPSNTYINLVTTEVSDNRNEFDESGSLQFVPDKGGWYNFYGGCRIENATDGDGCLVRLYNVTQSSSVGPGISFQTNGNAAATPISMRRNLTAGETYEVQATNGDSSFVINDFGTTLQITRSVVQ